MNESAAWEKVSVVYFPTTENIYQDAFSHAAAFLGSDVLMDVKAHEKKVTYYRQMKLKICPDCGQKNFSLVGHKPSCMYNPGQVSKLLSLLTEWHHGTSVATGDLNITMIFNQLLKAEREIRQMYIQQSR